MCVCDNCGELKRGFPPCEYDGCPFEYYDILRDREYEARKEAEKNKD